jgi:hypothetical protein
MKLDVRRTGVRTRAGLAAFSEYLKWEVRVRNRRRVWIVLAHQQRIARAQVDPLARLSRHITGIPLVCNATGEWESALARVRFTPDVVGIQTHWDVNSPRLSGLLESIKVRWPDTRVLYLDWFAPIDLRHSWLFDEVDVYAKKHVLKDRTGYIAGFSDTNLVEYEAQLAGQDMLGPRHDGINVPRLQSRLFVGWNFGASDEMVRLLNRRLYRRTDRHIDLHCRITLSDAVNGWYSHMRRRCFQAAKRVATSQSIVTSTLIPQRQYIRELTCSHICFSPFGFGEVCWRDFEAIACGAVVLKQDMSHLETYPNVFVPYETYVPVKWDLSDFSEKCEWLLKNPRECRNIAMNAARVWARYLDEELLQHVSELFARLGMRHLNDGNLR